MDKINDTLRHRQRIAQRNGKIMPCPRCKSSLIIGYDRDVEVDHCEKCEGIWVDLIDEKQLLAIKPDVFSIDELRRLRKLYKPLEHTGRSGYVPCPVCNQLMQRKNWGSYSGVIVDQCGKHGVWYDKGELEKVKEYITLGGIEYEKLRMTEERLSELDLKLMQEVHRLDKKIDSSYMRARLYSILGF